MLAICTPNDKDDPSVLQSDPWQQYQRTVDAIEAEVGDDLFSAVPSKIQHVLKGQPDPGPQALTLTLLAGDGQSAIIGAHFATQLTVEVCDGSGQPVEGVAVTFASLGTSADAQFSNSDSQIRLVTNSEGRASVTVSAAVVPGVYRVEASVAGVYTLAVIMLTNVAGYTVALSLVLAP